MSWQPLARLTLRPVAGLWLVLSLLPGCAGRAVNSVAADSLTRTSHQLEAARDGASCRKALRPGEHVAVAELDSRRIELLSWNIQKARHPRAIVDLGRFAVG